MKAATLGTLLAICALPAMADDTGLVGRQAMGCFKYGPVDLQLEASADIDVDLDGLGVPTGIRVIRYQPDSDRGRELALDAATAIRNCGPYPVISIPAMPTTVSLTMGPGATFPEPSIISLPNRADGLDDSLGNDLMKIIEGK